MIRDFERMLARYADMPVIAQSVLGPPARSASRSELRAFTEAFQGYIARKYGRRFREFIGGTITVTGSRQIIVVDVESVQTSCGYSVPLMELKGHRDTLERYWQNKGADAALETQQNRNAESIDGFDTGLND